MSVAKLNALDKELKRHPWYITVGLDEDDTVLIYIKSYGSEDMVMDAVNYVDIKEVEIIFTNDMEFKY